MKKKLLPLLALITLFTFQQCEEALTQPEIDELLFGAEVATASFTVTEKGGDQTITVEFDAAVSTSISVEVAVSGTAVIGEDYRTTLDESDGSYFISVPEGSTSKSFTFTPIDNENIDDGDRTAIFTATTTDSRVTLGNAEVTVTIENDDFQTEIEQFLLNSGLTTLLYEGVCDEPVIIIDYDNDGYPTSITLDNTTYYEYDYDEDYIEDYGGDLTDVFEVHYDEESIWLTSDYSDYSRNDADIVKDEISDTVMEILIDNGKIDEITLSGGLRKGRTEQSSESVLSFSYDESGRISEVHSVSEYSNSTTSVVYLSATEIEIYESYTDEGDRAEGESPIDLPSAILEIDDMKNPYNGIAAVASLLGNSRGSSVTGLRAFLSNNITSYIEDDDDYGYELSYDYTYNVEGYPTGAVIGIYDEYYDEYYRTSGVVLDPYSYTIESTYHYDDKVSGGAPEILYCAD